MPIKNYIVASAVMTLFVPVAAFAQTTGTASAAATAPAGASQLGADGKITLAPGTEVYDTQGGRVGQLTKVEGANVVLKTSKSEVLIPASSLARTEKNALIAMTAAQIDAAAAAAGGGQAAGAGGSADTGAAAGTSAQSSGPAGSANPSN